MTRQRNYFNSLVSNWDEVKEAQEIAVGSEGAAAEKYAAYTESVARSIERIQNSWEKFTNKVQASGLIKSFSEFLSFIVEHADSIIGVMTAVTAPNVVGGVFDALGRGDTKVSGFFKNKLGFGKSSYTPYENEMVTEVKKINKWLNDEKSGPDKQDEGGLTIGGKVVKGVVSGVIGGAMGLMTTEAKYGYDEKIFGGVLGAASGALSAAGPLGMAAGAVINGLSPFIVEGYRQVVHGQEVAREQRMQIAKEHLDAINGIKDEVNNGIESIKTSNEEMTASQWKEWSSSISGIKEAYAEYDEEMKSQFEKYVIGSDENIYDVFGKLESRTGNYEELMQRIAAATERMAGEAEKATNEQTRIDIMKELAKAEDEKEKSRLQSKLRDLDRKELESLVKAAYHETGISSMTSLDVAMTTLDDVLEKWGAQVDAYGGYGTSGAGTVGDSFRKVATSIMRQNDILMALMSGNPSVRLGSAFKDGAPVVDLSNFKNALLMSEDELKANASSLWWVTSKDVQGDLTNITEKFNLMNTALQEITKNGKASGDTIQKLAKQAPELFIDQKTGNFSQENLRGNIIGILTGSGKDVYKRIAASMAYSDEGSYSMFRAILQNRGQGGMDDETWAKLTKTAHTFQDVSDIILNDAQLMEDFANAAGETTQAFELINDLMQTASKWQIHLYDEQIKNLESQRDSLDQITNDREKEVNLIRARQKLENAKSEKKRVYRAGIGWTYESDQEAVSQAREELDRLDREQQKENLQQQIDLLTQQKELLASIDENEELKAIKKTAEDIAAALGTKGSFTESLTNFIKEEKSVGGEDVSKEIIDEGTRAEKQRVQNLIDTVKEQQQYVETAKQNLDKIQPGRFGFSEAQSAYNDSIDSYTNAMAALQGDQFFKTHQGWFNLDGVGKTYSKDAQSATFDSLFQESGKNVGNKFEWYTKNNWEEEEKLARLVRDGKNGLEEYGDAEPKIDSAGAKNIFGKWIQQKFEKEGISDPNGKLYKYWIDAKNLSYGDMIRLKDGRIIRKGYDDNLYIVNSESALNGGWGANGASRARGDLSFKGGNVKINERGLEGIVTPGGTITALPSHTGIVPADLTKNLYRLGEVAPNLIRRFGLDSNLESKYGFGNQDNSMNVQNLYATFETDDGFDFEALMRQARQYVALSKH